MEKTPFGSIEAQARPRGISCGRELQAQVLSGTLAVQSKVLSQVLKNLLHGNKTPFGSIEAQSPAPGHRIVNGLSQTHAFSKIHAVFSDGLAERGKQLLHAVASPFPGHAAL